MKRTSAAEKKAKGTARPDRPPPEMVGEPVIPLIAPDWLSEDAKRAWESVRPQLEGMVTAAETPMLEVYCCLLAEFRAGMAEGGTRMKSQDIAQMRGLAASFGLLPAERARVPRKKEPKKPSEWKDFDGKGK